ncbi:MAG: phage tail tape measure protein [Nitrosomonadaceae bacterium]
MAFNVSYIFQARDQFSAVARKVRKQTKGLRQQFKGLRAQLTRTNTAFKKTSRTMSSGFRRMALAAIGFFGARQFIREGSEFQSSMADLSAITGAVGKDFDLLKAKTLSLAKVSKTAQSEVALGIKLVASAKPELLENLPLLIKTTEQMLLLKNASGIELATAVEVGAQSLNIFGKGAEFASKFVNILAAGSKFGSSEIADTGQAVLISGNAAVAAGLSFLQLNAAIQATALGGIKGSRAGTALQAIFGRLRRQGLDIQKLGLEKTFNIIGKALDAEKDSTKRALLEAKLFGEEHAKVGLALVNNASMLGKFEKSLAGTNVAQEQANVRLDTFSAKARGLGIVIRDKLIRVFLKLSPTFEKITKDATDFIDSITPRQIEIFSNGLRNFTLAAVEVVKQLSTQLIPTIREFFASMDSASVSDVVNNLTSIAAAVNLILAPIKLLAALFKGVGTAIGEGAAQLATFNFDAKNATSFLDAFTIGGSFLGLVGREKTVLPQTPSAPSVSPLAANSQAEVNVNIKAPDGVVESVKTTQKGDTSALNLGVNMMSAA